MTVLMLDSIRFVAAQAQEAKSPQGNWANLKQLPLGRQIPVVLNDAKSCAGQLHSVSDEHLVIRTGRREQTFERPNILRVSSQGKSHRSRSAIISLVVGASAQVAIGVAFPELGQGKSGQGSALMLRVPQWRDLWVR
jgi:hypothetical protein